MELVAHVTEKNGSETERPGLFFCPYAVEDANVRVIYEKAAGYTNGYGGPREGILSEDAVAHRHTLKLLQ